VFDPKDIVAIERNVRDFAFAVAAKDCAGIAATFADDGRLTNMSKSLGREDVETVGPAAIQALFESFLPHMNFVHPMVQTRVLSIDGDRAKAETMIQETMCAPDGTVIIYFANYDDDLVRTAQGWRFASRTGVPRATVMPQATAQML
jgi:ketosteroid isomerase-like protein